MGSRGGAASTMDSAHGWVLRPHWETSPPSSLFNTSLCQTFRPRNEVKF